MSAYAPDTDELIRLFNPRIDVWRDHFLWDEPRLEGLTPMARATLELLQINSASRVRLRELLIEAGVFPPAVKR